MSTLTVKANTELSAQTRFYLSFEHIYIYLQHNFAPRGQRKLKAMILFLGQKHTEPITHLFSRSFLWESRLVLAQSDIFSARNKRFVFTVSGASESVCMCVYPSAGWVTATHRRSADTRERQYRNRAETTIKRARDRKTLFYILSLVP